MGLCIHFNSKILRPDDFAGRLSRNFKINIFFSEGNSVAFLPFFTCDILLQIMTIIIIN